MSKVKTSPVTNTISVVECVIKKIHDIEEKHQLFDDDDETLPLDHLRAALEDYLEVLDARSEVGLPCETPFFRDMTKLEADLVLHIQTDTPPRSPHLLQLKDRVALIVVKLHKLPLRVFDDNAFNHALFKAISATKPGDPS